MTAAAPPATHTTAVPMRNGLGIAALCCGLVGILVGLIPIMFLASGTLGILALVFGIIGTRRARRGEASNRGMAIAGLAAGVAACALAIWGITIVMSGLNSISSDLDQLDTGTVPPATGQHAVIGQEDRMVHQGLWIGNG